MAASTHGLLHTLHAVSQVCVVLRAPKISKTHRGKQQGSQVLEAEDRRQQPLCAPWSLISHHLLLITLSLAVLVLPSSSLKTKHAKENTKRLL